MTASAIVLYQPGLNKEVEGELHDSIGPAQIADWNVYWIPALKEIIEEIRRAGAPPSKLPQSAHWNWAAKMAQAEGVLAIKSACVVCDGLTQGLMRMDLNKLSRHSASVGKPLVYVDYLEVAPWNRPELGRVPRYKGVGSALVAAAVSVSLDEGFDGRIGLHSLPQADKFYAEHCKMTDFGQDSGYHNLRYFEMSAEQARAFVGEEGDG